MCVKIRLAEVRDTLQILEIYRPFVEDTSVSFEVEVPSETEFAKRIQSVLEKLPWLVCEAYGKIVGYAYASAHRARAAYQWSVDLTVYINPRYHRKRIATALYTALVGLLRVQGYYNAYAGVTLPNLKSENFHETFGFKSLGIYHHVGFKFDQWHDVKWFEYQIAELSIKPGVPKTLDEIKDTKDFENIIVNSTMIIKE